MANDSDKQNLHTHSKFCDGKDTPEEIVLYALKNNFSSLGFSSHMLTPFDTSYCLYDIDGYISDIIRLKNKYKSDIQIYLGIEEDALAPTKRDEFEYIIGSSHYIEFNRKYYPIDMNYDILCELVKIAGGPIALAEKYYSSFCDYIKWRKPDIIGHFDLLTKFEEKQANMFFSNDEYIKLSKKYLSEAIRSESIFEVNTGAISRGYRLTPYPHESLLYELKCADSKVIITSDCHDKNDLSFYFTETKQILKEIGFQYIYLMFNNQFIKEKI